jgi:hypothetical protein
MKIEHIRRISTVAKMKNHLAYHLAKSGDIDAAQRLVNQTVPDCSVFQNLNGFALPVMKPKGNQIPLALAQYMISNSMLTLCDSVFLQPTSHGSSMVERLYYKPYFSGTVNPGNYIIVDDVYTTGQTLKSLKRFLESKGATVTSAWCLGSAATTQFEPNRLLVKILVTKFPSISNYFDIDSLTVPQIQYLLRLSSINRLWQIHSDNQLALSFA